MRYQDAHRKFLFGLSFEKAGLALIKKRYLSSQKAIKICQILLSEIEQNHREHVFYKAGEAAFNSQQFMEDIADIDSVKIVFNDDWKKIRYHNLVRLGGDILRSGLGGYSKATVLGALLFYAENKSSF